MGFRSSLMKCHNRCPFRVLLSYDSIVVTRFVQRCRGLVELWCWGDYELVSIWFLLFFFSFLFIGVCFRFVPWRWRWVVTLFWLWFCLKILNVVFWIEDTGSLVLALFCWMHISIQYDWFYLVFLERARCVDALRWR